MTLTHENLADARVSMGMSVPVLATASGVAQHVLEAAEVDPRAASSSAPACSRPGRRPGRTDGRRVGEAVLRLRGDVDPPGTGDGRA
jgi:hypothetical protein